VADREKLDAVVYADKTVDEQMEELQQTEGSGRSWQPQSGQFRYQRQVEVESFPCEQWAQEPPELPDCMEQRQEAERQSVVVQQSLELAVEIGLSKNDQGELVWKDCSGYADVEDHV